MGLAAASAAGLLTRPAFSDAHPFTAAPFSPSAPLADPDLDRRQREGLHDGRGAAEGGGVRGERRAVHRRREQRGHQRARSAREAQTFDAKGMTVVPGFTDCHNHAGGTTLLYEVLVGNPFEVEFVTIDSIVEKLRAKAQQTPPGTWVEGYFFDDTKVKDKRQLNVHDLDKVSTEHPVVVHHRGGHTSFYNSKALEMARRSPRTRPIRRAARSTATRTAS